MNKTKQKIREICKPTEDTDIERPWEALRERLDYPPQKYDKVSGQPLTSKPLCSDSNLIKIVRFDPRKSGKLSYNSFSDLLEWERRPLRDIDVLEIKLWIEEVYGVKASKDRIFDVCYYVAHQNTRDPLLQFLELCHATYLSTPEEERKSIYRLLPDYFGTKDNELHREIGARFMISAVRRGRADESCPVKADSMLMLCGEQGAGKSTGVRALAGGSFFSDSHLDMRSKEAYQMIHSGIWIFELAELHALRGRDAENVKMFLSALKDRWRRPYERTVTIRARRCCFIGTSNDKSGILSDPSGSRRFWPVNVGKVDLEGIIRDRILLWGHAVELSQDPKNSHYLDTTELVEALKSHNEEYQHTDPWEVAIDKGLALNPGGITVSELLTGKTDENGDLLWGVGMKQNQQHSGHSRRVSGILQKLGALKERKQYKGKRQTIWRNQ